MPKSSSMFTSNATTSESKTTCSGVSRLAARRGASSAIALIRSTSGSRGVKPSRSCHITRFSTSASILRSGVTIFAPETFSFAPSTSAEASSRDAVASSAASAPFNTLTEPPCTSVTGSVLYCRYCGSRVRMDNVVSSGRVRGKTLSVLRTSPKDSFNSASVFCGGNVSGYALSCKPLSTAA